MLASVLGQLLGLLLGLLRDLTVAPVIHGRGARIVLYHISSFILACQYVNKP